MLQGEPGPPGPTGRRGTRGITVSASSQFRVMVRVFPPWENTFDVVDVHRVLVVSLVQPVLQASLDLRLVIVLFL